MQARLAVLPCSGGESVLRRLFEPLGYHVTAERHPLDERAPEWSDSEYCTVTLTGTLRLCDLLSHLYVLVPVLDDEKHYWIGEDEVAKLLRYGEGWLARHPERELIARRYLKHQRDLTNAALAQLADEDDADRAATEAQGGEAEDTLEASIGLQHQRLEAVLAALHDRGSSRVLDLGCSAGRLIRMLLHDQRITEVIGMDVSRRRLDRDVYGLPVRHNWAAEYCGQARVVYGHMPTPEAEWLNRTINLDTGCVFGGKLTALRYPELTFVSVPAARIYTEPIRPFLPATADPRTAQQQADEWLDLDEVLGKQAIHTRLWATIVMREEQSAAALEVMSRFAINPRWLIYLPPTMSPPDPSDAPDWLEDPAQVLGYYRRQRLSQVICEGKHMGSRVILIVCRDAAATQRSFGLVAG